jgi:murein DD-endopeptidase MepM/ murein hydrolase activator NlpD
MAGPLLLAARSVALAGLAFAAGAACAQGRAPAAPVLDLPVRCAFGSDCFVQQYFDHDAGAGAKDYRCGPMSYDGHDGTDFRLPTLRAQRAGVEVVAAAQGVVRSARDGMADQDVRIAGAASVKGRECGNGVLLAHAGGWETQYCHMANGSVLVRPGDAVARGAKLGFVGESGDAAFPHLHLSVRHNGVKVDPFAAREPAGACGAGPSLWSAAARAALAYRSPELINAGFAGQPITMEQVEAGSVSPPPGRATTRLIAYARFIGLSAGDSGTLSLAGPDGAPLASQDMPALANDRAQQLLFVGRERPAGWARGTYVARLVVRRGGAAILDKTFDIDL